MSDEYQRVRVLTSTGRIVERNARIVHGIDDTGRKVSRADVAGYRDTLVVVSHDYYGAIFGKQATRR